MSTPEPIRKLGRYELLKRIAKGGMGEIYLARTRGAADFQKNCIIKTILPHLAEEEEFLTKFLDEGRIVVQLVHGNIVPVFDMGDEAGEVFIAMEYIPGRDLREVTKRLSVGGASMPVDIALFITSEVCKGLDYAHRKTTETGEPLEIVHRDVSPSNVLISREGEVKLIDFGIARAAGKLGKTVSGRIQGKFCYMSPEQASGKKLDGRSDIFSTGLVLYELLTGHRPFQGETDLESLDMVRHCEFDPPSTLNPSVPDEIDAIVTRALQKSATDRYATIDKLQIAILQYLYSTGTSPTSNDLENFLGGLFPEGLERDELRSARDSSAPEKQMSLDEALDFEFDKLGGLELTADVDPHEATAVSTAQQDLPQSATKPTAPDKPEPELVTPSTTAEAQLPRRRGVTTLVVGALLLLAGGVYAVTANSSGQRTVGSSPPGAQVSVDGLLIPGAVTPYTLSLEEGTHTIELELDGHQSAALKVEVGAGSTKKLAVTKLKPVERPSGPKTFRLLAEPTSSEFLIDNAVLGAPTITLTPGEVVRVVARHPGCQSKTKTVQYGQSNMGVTFDLKCTENTPDMGQEPPKPQAVTTKKITIKSAPAGAEITINGKSLGTTPVTWSGRSDTMLTIVATKAGVDPTRKRSRASRLPRSFTISMKGGGQGCVDLSIINPMFAEWFIDGQPLGEKRGFKNHRVSSGPHTVRVKNAKMDLDYRQKILVEKGQKCTKLLLDGARLSE